MKIKQLRKNWEQFGREDPFWSILASPETKGGKWNPTAFFETGTKHITNLLHKIEHDLGHPVDRTKALDFGCGAGRCTLAMGLHFNEVIGIDIASSMIELAKSHQPEESKITYLRSEDPELTTFADNTFSFIYSNLTLQHMKPALALRYLTSFMRLLKPGGILYFQLPAAPPKGLFGHVLTYTPYWILGLYRRLRYSNQPVMEMYWIPSSKVLKLLQSQGGIPINEFDERSADGFNYHYYFISKGQ